MGERLTDISDVCRMFDITSRTLRYYEEKHVITSTAEQGTRRRKYTEQQIKQLKNVLVLRKIGISLDDIHSIFLKDGDLHAALTRNRAKIYSSIYEQNKILSLLNEAIAVVESGKDIFGTDDRTLGPEQNVDVQKAALICTRAFVENDMDTLYSYMSGKVTVYMPKEAFENSIRPDSLEPVGAFMKIGECRVSEEYPNVVYVKIYYQKLGVELKYVFHDGKVAGFWMNYFEVGRYLQ